MPALHEIKLSLLRISVQTAPLFEEGRATLLRRELKITCHESQLPPGYAVLPLAQEGESFTKPQFLRISVLNCPSLRTLDERSGGGPVLVDNIVTVPNLQKAQKGERAAKGLKCYSLALTGVYSFAILRTLPPAIVISKKTSLKIALFIRTTTIRG